MFPAGSYLAKPPKRERSVLLLYMSWNAAAGAVSRKSIKVYVPLLPRTSIKPPPPVVTRQFERISFKVIHTNAAMVHAFKLVSHNRYKLTHNRDLTNDPDAKHSPHQLSRPISSDFKLHESLNLRHRRHCHPPLASSPQFGCILHSLKLSHPTCSMHDVGKRLYRA